ncbi:galactose oxidase, central domain-containing protein [Sarocladium implicatum]|nr:galactose oxidase, central domain-containing protein [Sarocladium implicatum]
MEQFSMIRRRTTDLLKNAQQNLPSMPQLPSRSSETESKQSMLPKTAMKGTWERIYVPELPRSSHTVNVVSNTAYIFGGEISPREPVDNDMHVVRLPFSSGGVSADYFCIKAKPDVPDEDNVKLPGQSSGPDSESNLDSVPLETGEVKDKGKGLAIDNKSDLGDVPSPRVGHASAVIGSRIFIFGGRGGPEMKPLDEAGRVWVFDTRTRGWSYLDPTPAVQGGAIVARPSPRSYHCATATDRPRDFGQPQQRKARTWQEWAVGDTSKTGIPQAPIVGNVAMDAVDEESEGYGTFFIHAGCLADGERANDLWAFDIRTKTWSQLPAAPGSPRGGTAICISKSRLFRFGGFDGQTEIGGQLDFIDLEVETFNDRDNKGEIDIRARGTWQSILENNIDASSTEIPAVPQQDWPAPRSVASLEAITLGGGREYLVLAMGERGPSNDGHAAAGTFHSDVWMFQVPPLGMSAASMTDAFLQLTGRKTGEGQWTRVTTMPHDDDVSDEEPVPRGWLASAPMTDLEDNAIILWGGLDDQNERLGDGWILRLG